MANGDRRLDASGNLLLDSSGNLFLDTSSCPDDLPCNVLMTITGTTQAGGCLTGGIIPATWTFGPFAGLPASAQWHAATNPFNFTLCLSRIYGEQNPCSAPCYTWAAANSLSTYPIILDVFGNPIPCANLPIPHQNNPTWNFFVTRNADTTWSFTVSDDIDPNIYAGFFTGPLLSGTSAAKANCMDAFSISLTGSVLVSGGTASFTPGGC